MTTTPDVPAATRNLFVSMMTSLDGFIEGPHRELEWVGSPAADFSQYCDDMLDSIDLMLYGRVAYELMAKYWPPAESNPASSPRDRAFAVKMNRIPKLVLSRTLTSASWSNTRVLRDRVPETLRELKQQPGKRIAAFGGADLVASLTRHRLVDEYRVIVQPLVLGAGRALFKDLDGRLAMKLIKATTLPTSGFSILHYAPTWS